MSMEFSSLFRPAMLTGRKICTSRSEKRADVGDIFTVEETKFRVLEISLCKLGNVMDNLYRLEGFDKPEEFRDAWKLLHEGEWDEDTVVHVHFFSMLPRGD